MVKHLEFVDRFENEEQDNEDISYICTFKIRDCIVEIFLSDYGQSFFTKIKYPDDEVHEYGLGTYNECFLEEVCGILDPKGVFISEEGLEAWDEMTESLKERWEKKGWKDERPDEFEELMKMRESQDYDTYDFESMYKELENYER